jgi:hypothetical protein
MDADSTKHWQDQAADCGHSASVRTQWVPH